MDNAQERQRHVKVLRKKDVAEVTRAVLKGNDVDLPQIQASLHHTLRGYHRGKEAERRALDEILESNYLLSRAVLLLSQDVQMLKALVRTLQSSSPPVSGTDNHTSLINSR
jgi:hypothetical protein